MSYQREKLSGAQYKKLAKEKHEKEEKVVASTRKIDNYFSKSLSAIDAEKILLMKKVYIC